MAGRLEPPHRPFPLTGGLMGVFGTIIEGAMLPMLHAGEDLPFDCAVARQFIRNDHPGDIPQAFEELNDVRRKPMTLIQVGRRWSVHAVSMPHPAEAVKAHRLI